MLFSSEYTLYLNTENSPSVTLETSVEAPKEPETSDEGGRTMGKCGTDLDAEMEGTTNDAHSHVDIGEMDRPATTQGTVQVDTNTSVENTKLLPIIKGKVLNRHAISVAYVLEWHSAYSLNVSYMKCHSISQCKDVASCGGADHRRMAKLAYL